MRTHRHSAAAASSEERGSPTAQATHEELLRPFLHDLNNLLGIVLGNAELMLDPRTTDERRVKRAESIYHAAIKVRDLVVKLQARLPE
jgi:hypothetical protein